MKKTLINGLLLLLVLNITSCSKEKKNTDIVITSEINMEHQMLNFASTKTENNAHSGKFYSSVDSVTKYGAGYSYVIPDSLKDRNLKVYIKAWVREQESPLNGTITVALSTSKGVAFWGAVAPKVKDYAPNTWVEINDSVLIASTLLKDSFTELSIFGFKDFGKDRLDLDDLNIRYKFSK